MRVTVWNERVHEQQHPGSAEQYPDGIHGAIADGLRSLLGDAASIGAATMDQPRHGLPPDVLDRTDVLVWWSHIAHDAVDDEVAADVCRRIHAGMGFVALHSSLGSKVFKRLMGTTCRIDWRHGDRELLWTVEPSHPIARGVPNPVAIQHSEMYGEPFDIPPPDELVFISSFTGGEVFRSGCCFYRGRGRVFFFAPGHEEYPIYFQPEIQRIIANGVEWAQPQPEAAVEPDAERAQGWYEQQAVHQ